MKRLENRVGIVTGAARGIGKAICVAFASEGATVVVTDVDEREGEQVASEIRESGGKAIYSLMDVTKRAQIRDVVQRAKKEFQKIDILVNNAGIVEKWWVKDMPEEVWDRIMAIDAKGTFLCSQAVLPMMIAQKRGKIINIASVSGKIGDAANSAYAASKFAVIGFTQALADEVGKYNILVNAICPGPVPTKLGEYGVREDAKLRGMSMEDFRAEYLRRTPLGRQGTCEEVAKVAVFFASDECSFTTGCTFLVSGGMVKD